jgi:hypothetical protein
MSFVNGVNLLPSIGEFTYATTAHQGQRVSEAALVPINIYQGETPAKTDYSFAIDQLQAAFPACQTVTVVCSWFGSSIDAPTCKIYPSTTYIGGSFQRWTGLSWASDTWECSSLTQSSPGLIPISQDGGAFTYGGTPSDQSIVECITDLKSRGFRVVFYPFILMDSPGKPRRGRITYSPDTSSAAASAVSSFLGSAVPANFMRDNTNKTVSYSGSPTDFTYRRMILHYANLCVVAGCVDLFLIGSEFRGLETIRGPAWTNAGTTDGGGNAIWDYPFVQVLITLSDDVRSIFDAAGYTKDTSGLHNLISYAADWSDWMGFSHAESSPASPNGQWPHLDKLWAHINIDLVAFDNYLPLSDWTTGGGGLDVLNWRQPAPTSWPPPPSQMSGLGLTGTPTLQSIAYLKANIEGGEKFNWFYFDSNNLGRGLDPDGSDLQVSLPKGDRLTQSRNPFFSNQQILGQKQLRWWWNNNHQALYDTGSGEAPQGPTTEWVPQSKSIVFTEYGFPASDKCTNQPNVFFDASSTESGTAYWSIWRPADGGGFLPQPDQNLSLLALQAIYEYWFEDGNNAFSGTGLKMIEPSFCSVWNWDARPFPVFPALSSVWGDACNWQAGNWLNGKGPFLTPPVPDPVPGVSMPFKFPSLPGLSWSVHKRPSFSTRIANHVSGREVRAPFYAVALYEFELTIEGLDSNGSYPGLGVNSLQALMGLYLQCQGQFGTFLYVDPTDNTEVGQTIGIADGRSTTFTLQRSLGYDVESVSWTTGVTQAYLNSAPVPQYKLAEDGSTGNHFVAQTLMASQAIGAPITLSCYVKAAERSACTLQIYDGVANHFCHFNLSSVTATPGSGIVSSSISVANAGWYLISATVSMATTGFPIYSVFLDNPAGTTSYVGATGNGIYLSSVAYSAGNVAPAFLSSLIATGATIYGPNWTITEPNALTFVSSPLVTPTTSYKLAEDSSNGNHLTQQNVASQVAGTPITFYVYVQSAERSACAIEIFNGSANVRVDVNIATATINPVGSPTAYSITNAGGGWFLVSISTVMTATAIPTFFIQLANPYQIYSYAGTTGSGILFAGGSWQIDSGVPVTLPAFSTVTGSTAATNAATPPSISTSIAADFTYAFNCRFLDDQEDFEQFINGLWQVQSLKFRSVKP